jgi:hypothetical protein
MHINIYNRLRKLLLDNSINNLRFIYFCIITASFFSCNDVHTGGVITLDEYSDSISKPFISFDTIAEKRKGVRGIEFMTSYEEWPFPLKGKLFSENHSIWVSLNQPNKDTFKLFDFKFTIKESQIISWRISGYESESDTLVEKSHILVLQNKFFDKNLNDSVYQFRLDSIGLIGQDDNVVCFVTKKHWIVGLYIGEYLVENDSIVEAVAPTFGNIYKSKLNYSNVDFDYVIK